MAYIERRTRKDGSDGYRVAWRDPDTRKRDSATFDDPKEADHLKAFLDANGQRLSEANKVMNAIRRNSPTVADILEHHIDHLTGVSSRTRADYRRDARNHINPELGSLPVDVINKDHVRDWVNNREMAAKTIANVHALLSAALDDAVPQWRGDNPASGVRLPTHHPEEMVFLTAGEFTFLLGKIPPEHQLVVRFLVSTGLRWGEMVVLTVSDFHLLGHTPTVRVSKALKRGDDNKNDVGPPKTRRARKTAKPVTIVYEVAGDSRQVDVSYTTFGQQLSTSSETVPVPWTIWVLGPVALVMGHVSLSQIDSSGEAGKGQAITGTVLVGS